MTLDQAIELLRDEAQSPRYLHAPDKVDAFKLGIEALKEVEHARSISFGVVSLKLPGETKD